MPAYAKDAAAIDVLREVKAGDKNGCFENYVILFYSITLIDDY
jgi:hypothetical protein